MAKIAKYGMAYETNEPTLKGKGGQKRKEKANRLKKTRHDVDRRYMKHGLSKGGKLEIFVNENLSIIPDEQGYESVDLRFLADLDGSDQSWSAKRQVRYWCYRFRNEASGGAAAISDQEDSLPDVAADFKTDVEAQPWFNELGGWLGFAVRWDVDWCDPLNLENVKRRRRSVWKEWERDLASKVPVLPH